MGSHESLEIEEVTGQALLALVECAERYDPARGPFGSWAAQTIYLRLIDWARDQAPMSRLEMRTGELIIGRGRRAKRCAGRRVVVSLDAETGRKGDDHEPLTLADTIADPRDDYETRERHIDTVAALQELRPRERFVVGQMVMREGRDIGAELGVSQSMVSLIRTGALKKMRKAAA